MTMRTAAIALSAIVGAGLAWLAMVALSTMLFGGPGATLSAAGAATWALLVALATAGGGITGGRLAAYLTGR